MSITATELREQAILDDQAAQDSFERCDTDGALSQWAHSMNAQEARLQADIEENGGRALFLALFDTAGNLVPAKRMDSQYSKHGIYFALLDGNGRITGQWFTPSQSQDARRARKADAAKGFYVGYVMAPAKAELRGGNVCTVTAVAVRTDGGYSEDVEIVDNGQHDEFTFTLGRWYAVQGGLI
ncbi:hypothetical protein [Nonomuraea angiospora]|uniref:hypothetical protein n=1 Tax=Nonomuraea angiospora TaxID=46172 RepID=UPI0029B7204A|nr:hypothetical protein [Nonomuraea angiospora]MDX3100493.1 hypothetical protein [Nonomuraea angiospora]